MHTSLLTALAFSASLLHVHADFSKTVGYDYQTYTTSVPDCGTAVYTAGASCPSGCHLDPLNYGTGVKTTHYECKPTALPTSVVASPIVAILSCDEANHEFTTTVKPLYGADWTTCATASNGVTTFASAVTIALTTKAP